MRNGKYSENRRERHGAKDKGGRRRKRMFDYGDLRLMVLSLVSEQPRHGYEIIKCIEERFDGTYVPSPGAIYPTLEWLTDMGFVTVAQDTTGRKSAAISDAGTAFLEANRETTEELWKRRPPAYRRSAPPEIIASMDALKQAIGQSIEQDQDGEMIARVAAKIQALADELSQEGTANAEG